MSGKGVWRAGAFALIKETEWKVRRPPHPSPMWMVMLVRGGIVQSLQGLGA